MTDKFPFTSQRRQQFLSEEQYKSELNFLNEVITAQRENLLKPEGSDRGWHGRLLQGIAGDLYANFSLRYTAGEPISILRSELEEVIAAYEHYSEYLWKRTDDRNTPVFDFDFLDEYCELTQLIGLCFLLHRRDLLPRIAALQDGVEGKGNGGCDTLYEELMAFGIGPETRFETDLLCQARPYENLFYALTEPEQPAQLKELDLFLKHWYKDLEGVGWHDTHKTDEDGNPGGGYYGYWSFEAGAAVLLLGIEDDSSLHKYLYYPKDMVAWARAHASLGTSAGQQQSMSSVPGGQPCPQAGWWHTPAKTGSRRYFKAGEVMPVIEGSAYGETFWLWDANQEAPKL
ncbi:PoNe immunity protein domain-containing protein [uncultured Xanthomonas sp.]|uniref:PoNe immunity protein domain-containing protein n=1 Tax=uncultured Xanthomonas sp. TaxID=152831 RepID=UPI0025FC6389|nr:PoNe immunity protein domain-containing protein [uncultured Xanthomonas sp.]